LTLDDQVEVAFDLSLQRVGIIGLALFAFDEQRGERLRPRQAACMRRQNPIAAAFHMCFLPGCETQVASRAGLRLMPAFFRSTVRTTFPR
jgi:hypothetical protein